MLTYNIDEDIHIFLAILQNLINELEKIDGDINDSVKVGIVNRALPEDIRWINVFQFNNNWKECCNYLKRIIPDIALSMKREKKIKETKPKKIFHIENNFPKKRVPFKSMNNNRKNGKCYICGKYGHYMKNCLKNKRNKNNKKLKNKNFKKLRRKSNINNTDNNHNNNHAYLINNNIDNHNDNSINFTKDYNSENSFEIYYINTFNNIRQFSKISNNNITNWVLDSGASINITNDINCLTNIEKCHITMTTANGNKITINHFGIFTGYINNYKFTLKKVYYSKEIKRNIISLNQLIQQNYKVIFNNNNNPQAIIYDNDGNRIYHSYTNNNNTFSIFISKYPIHFNNNNNKNNVYQINDNEIYYLYLNKSQSMDLWHRRLGHFNISLIKHKLGNINAYPKCNTCINSKLKNRPYKRSFNKSTCPFELLHLDIVGPVIPSICGNKYFLTILDDYSRYGWVLFLTNKSETCSNFINWYRKMNNAFDFKIKFLRSDNGTEFTSTDFKSFCNFHGIINNRQFPTVHLKMDVPNISTVF